MVPEDVWASLPPDPEIKQGNYRIDGHTDEGKIRQPTQEIRMKRAQRDRQVVKEYRDYYFYNQPTWDIERQARGEEEKYAEPDINVIIPEHAALAKLFCRQPDDLTEDQIFERKIEAINLMIDTIPTRNLPGRGAARDPPYGKHFPRIRQHHSQTPRGRVAYHRDARPPSISGMPHYRSSPRTI
ncbi:hypothetical protein CEP54_015788 [Fusarium duplospermum]|uniref:Uncharacterized protein n=1 Tax=Fusarium duplospermum TaxID=1325734 RepID=A0A428NL41_9HYPO|nr:hypothetical protein CEP54_015788 [Fusarium duplospermum]